MSITALERTRGEAGYFIQVAVAAGRPAPGRWAASYRRKPKDSQ